MAKRRSVDLTVLAIPFYFGTMGLEYAYLRRQGARRSPLAAPAPTPPAGDYERRDTVASLTMGVASLVLPLLTARLLRPLTPGQGRHGRKLVGIAVGAAAMTTAADYLARRGEGERGEGERGEGERGGPERVAGRVASVTGVVAVVTGGLAVTTTWASRTTASRLWRRRVLPDLGSSPAAIAAAVAGWDFIYYWDHRFMHTSRYMWAIHVVHHSSEHYNLSTALRQPVAEAFGTFLPFGALSLLGIRPELVEAARGVNLLYQYWIHTDAIPSLGPAEAALNTPSHHRVHHGSNRRYLDRNHGSILIIWDKLFGTFEPEDEAVVYGLTQNINSFSPLRIATHEYVDMLRDVAASTSWNERLSYLIRGPGWAKAHRAARTSLASASL